MTAQLAPQPSYQIEDQNGTLIATTYDGEFFAKRLAAVMELHEGLNPDGLNRYYVRTVPS